MSRPPSSAARLIDSVPGLGTAAPLVPGLWTRPFSEPLRFAAGGCELDAEHHAQLDEIAVALSWFATSCIIEVAGHAWDEGNALERGELAQRRADVVREGLEARGLPSWVLRVRGYGSERPVGHGDGQESVADSRRVELWLRQRSVGLDLPCADPGGDGCCRDC